MTAPSALALFAVDPGLGMRLRGPADAGRAAFLAGLRAALPAGPVVTLPAGATEDRLLGGLDLAGSLAAGRRVAERGLLASADGGVLVVAMAERVAPSVAAALAASADTGQVAVERDGISAAHTARIGLLALDEGIGEESPPPALLDRLGLWVDAPVAPADAAPDTAAARQRLPRIAVPPDAADALVRAAAALGVASLRAPLLALRAARAAASLAGRAEVAEPDLACAAALVLAPRATRLPDQQPPPPPPDAEPEAPPEQSTGRLEDRVLEAARAALPPGLLAALAARGAQKAKSGGSSGGARREPTRGRPLGARAGLPRGGKRLHLLATLRAAAPWQRLRRATPGRLAIRREDFRIRRFRQRTQSTTIFVVDASGSAALHRLAEAKGAVELLLAECYIRRDQVALIALRGQGAELLLPPTSSLARAKKSLNALPGGGGTPLAAGIEAALRLASGVARAGKTPLAVFLTDGRANIALDGSPGRPAAEADALSLARAWRASGHRALLVDTAPRPHPFARRLAEEAQARYLPLPQADPHSLRAAVRAEA